MRNPFSKGFRFVVDASLLLFGGCTQWESGRTNAIIDVPCTIESISCGL